MLLLDFQSQSVTVPVRQASTGQGIEVVLAAGEHFAFNTYGQSIDVSVRRGRIWLTDGPVDHVLAGFETHVCPPRSRVVVTALTDVSLSVHICPNP